MSETKTTRKQLPAYLILALIALAAALLLAVTNAITAGPIKAHEEAENYEKVKLKADTIFKGK